MDSSKWWINEGGDLALDIDNVFEALQEVADSWEGEFAEPKVTTTQDDYAECVDTLVDKMGSSNV